MERDTQVERLAEFIGLYPVRRSTHTGRFGWRRSGGYVNLNACRFATEAEAADDRNAHFDAWLRHPEDFSR